MIVRDVDISPACCCLDCSVDGFVVVCTAFQNDRPDKYIAFEGSRSVRSMYIILCPDRND
jgi:hypothetical protein